MSRIPYVFSALALALSAGAAHSEEPAPAPDERQAQHAMKRFMQVCMDSQGKPDRVRAAAERAGLRALPPQAAGSFLNGAEGDAWAEQNELGSYAFASRHDGVCSVFVRRIDADLIEKAFTFWLPHNQSGFTATEPARVPAAEGIRTVTYDILRNGKPFAVWVLSTSRQENVNFQGVISMRGN